MSYFKKKETYTFASAKAKLETISEGHFLRPENLDTFRSIIEQLSFINFSQETRQSSTLLTSHPTFSRFDDDLRSRSRVSLDVFSCFVHLYARHCARLSVFMKDQSQDALYYCLYSLFKDHDYCFNKIRHEFPAFMCHFLCFCHATEHKNENSLFRLLATNSRPSFNGQENETFVSRPWWFNAFGLRDLFNRAAIDFVTQHSGALMRDNFVDTPFILDLPAEKKHLSSFFFIQSKPFKRLDNLADYKSFLDSIAKVNKAFEDSPTVFNLRKAPSCLHENGSCHPEYFPPCHIRRSFPDFKFIPPSDGVTERNSLGFCLARSNQLLKGEKEGLAFLAEMGKVWGLDANKVDLKQVTTFNTLASYNTLDESEQKNAFDNLLQGRNSAVFSDLDISLDSHAPKQTHTTVQSKESEKKSRSKDKRQSESKSKDKKKKKSKPVQELGSSDSENPDNLELYTH